MIALLLGASVAWLALLFAAFVVARAISIPVRMGSRVFRVRFHALLPRVLGYAGVGAFGVVWLADRHAPAALIAHEYRHLEQERQLLYVGYLPAYFALFLRHFSYWRHPMEVDARAFAERAQGEFEALEG